MTSLRFGCWRSMSNQSPSVTAMTRLTLEEIAAAEKINPSYVSRLLRTTLLAPEVVEAILDGRQPPDMTLALLMQPFGVLWAEQSQGFQGL